ncbi:MAG: DUF4388 domain-containing protein [Planctomycetota bacterium]|jgi:CheY-like chemotaxis protein
MARLRGEVEILPFPDLLQLLVSHKRVGTLTVAGGSHRKVLYGGKEGLRLLSTTTRRTNALGEILLRTKKVTRRQLDELLLEQRKTGVRLGQMVRKRGLVNQNDLTQALREQAEEEIYDLFNWEKASFDFVEGPPSKPLLSSPMASAVVDSNPTLIMLEAARRSDEIAMIKDVLRDGSMLPRRTGKSGKLQNLGMDADVLTSVYRAVNGKHTLDQVVQVSLFPRFDALRALYVLASNGFVKVVDREGKEALPAKKPVAEKKKAAPAPVKKAAVPAKPKKKAPPRKGTLILLGNLLTYRNALATLLKDAGYEVMEEAAEGAVRLLSGSRKIDAVILDVALDNPVGYDFCSWLSENLGAPILVLSSDPSDAAVRNAVAAGAADYVVKPFTRETILASISEALTGSYGSRR